MSTRVYTEADMARCAEMVDDGAQLYDVLCVVPVRAVSVCGGSGSIDGSSLVPFHYVTCTDCCGLGARVVTT